MSSDGSRRKASAWQVAKLMLSGVLMVGKRSAWEKGGDGARITPGQIVAGAIIGAIVLVAVLLAIVRIALQLATG
jgi:hypothetical protein